MKKNDATNIVNGYADSTNKKISNITNEENLNENFGPNERE